MSQMSLKLLATQRVHVEGAGNYANELNINECLIIMKDYEKQLQEKVVESEQLSEEVAQGEQRYQEMYARYEQAKQEVMTGQELKFTLEE